MKNKKIFVSIIAIVVALVVVYILLPKRVNLNLEEKIAKENIEDLTLTIYYVPYDPMILKYAPTRIEGLKKGDPFIVLEGESLSNALPLLYNLDNSKIIKVSKRSYIDAYVCYCLESSKNGMILEVGFWGSDNSIFVNGTEVYENAAFYDILFEYLPEDVMEEYIRYECIEVFDQDLYQK